MDKLFKQLIKDFESFGVFEREYRRVTRNLVLTREDLAALDQEHEAVHEAFAHQLEIISALNSTEVVLYLLTNRDPFRDARALKNSVMKRWQGL